MLVQRFQIRSSQSRRVQGHFAFTFESHKIGQLAIGKSYFCGVKHLKNDHVMSAMGCLGERTFELIGIVKEITDQNDQASLGQSCQGFFKDPSQIGRSGFFGDRPVNFHATEHFHHRTPMILTARLTGDRLKMLIK